MVPVYKDTSIHICEDNLDTAVTISGIAAGVISVCHFYHQWHVRKLLVAPSKNYFKVQCASCFLESLRKKKELFFCTYCINPSMPVMVHSVDLKCYTLPTSVHHASTNATYSTKNLKLLCLGSTWNLSLFVLEGLVHSSSFLHLGMVLMV